MEDPTHMMIEEYIYIWAFGLTETIWGFLEGKTSWHLKNIERIERGGDKGEQLFSSRDPGQLAWVLASSGLVDHRNEWFLGFLTYILITHVYVRFTELG